MVRRAVLWSFAGQIASFLLTFGGSVILARLLSPHEVGIYAVATAALGVLQIVTSFGVSVYAVREIDTDGKILDTAFTINLLLSILLAAIIVAMSTPASSFLKEPAVASVLRLLALAPLISNFGFRGGVLLQREMQFGKASAIAVASNFTMVLVSTGSAYYGASYMSAAYGSLASTSVAALATLILKRGMRRAEISFDQWHPIATFGLQMMSVGGVANAAARLSDVLVGRFLGLSSLGLLSRASNLSNLVSTYIHSSVNGVVYAQLAKDYRERGVIRDTFIPGLRMILAATGPLMIGMAILAKPLVFILYGEKWAAVAPILAIYMLAQFLSLSFALNWELYVVRNKLALQVKLEMTRSFFGVFTKLVGCLFGLLGAAAATIVDAVFSIFLYVPNMPKLADSSRNEIARIYAEVFFLAAAAGLPSLVVMEYFSWSEKISLLVIIPAVLSGGLLWLGLLFKIRHPLASELVYFKTKLKSRFFVESSASN